MKLLELTDESGKIIGVDPSSIRSISNKENGNVWIKAFDGVNYSVKETTKQVMDMCKKSGIEIINCITEVNNEATEKPLP